MSKFPWKHFLLLVMILSVVMWVACGDDDDDDTVGDDDQTGEAVFNEDGLDLGDDGEDGPFGSGICTDTDCLEMLIFMDECKFNCVDNNDEPIPCTDLYDYCVECGGNWSVNITCHKEYNQPDSCMDFIMCCAGQSD